MKNQFELEQQILDCWNVLDDIKMILELPESERESLLKAIHTLYHAKFEILFSTFEEGLRSDYKDVHSYNAMKRHDDKIEQTEEYEDDGIDFDGWKFKGTTLDPVPTLDINLDPELDFDYRMGNTNWKVDPKPY